jgi:hypothetical protein
VRTITRVAEASNEARLVEIALHTTANQLEKICRAASAANPARPETLRQRSVSLVPGPDGLMRVVADLLPDEAALLMKAIEHAQSTLPPPTDPRAIRRFATRPDALLAIARAAIEPEQSEIPLPNTPVELIIEIRPDLLSDGWTANLDDGSHVPAGTFRRLACDAGLVLVSTDAAGNALDVGRRTRTISPALRRALWRRDGGCRFPGCTSKRFLDGHHLESWLHGGPTSLANTGLVCRPHHRLLHEGGWTVFWRGAVLVFRDPTGRELLSVPPGAPIADDPVATLAADAAARGVDIDADTSRSRWDGEPIDYIACTEAILPRVYGPRAPTEASSTSI